MKTRENNYKSIGLKIKEAREFANMSQKDLADKIGYESATAISLLESGERKVSIGDLQKMSDIFKLDIKFFLGQKEKKPDFLFALRADKSLTQSEQDQILNFIDFVKKQNNARSK